MPDCIILGQDNNYKLRDIDIIASPTRTIYEVGETFDSTGLRVRAYYGTGSQPKLKEVEIYNYTILINEHSINTPLTKQDQFLTIIYTENGQQVKKTYTSVTVTDPWSWGDETAIGNSTWWTGLKKWILNKSTASERAACVGKTKLVSLSSPVLGANAATMICIGADQDGSKTLTFQTQGVLPNQIAFSTSGTDWETSTAKTECQKFKNYCSASQAISPSIKGTCKNLSSARNCDPIYAAESIWIPSEREMGLDSYSPLSVANSNIIKAECTKGYNAAYSYYTSNSNRTKYIMNADGTLTTSTTYYWTRSRHYSNSSKICSINWNGIATSFTYNALSYLAPAFIVGKTS